MLWKNAIQIYLKKAFLSDRMNIVTKGKNIQAVTKGFIPEGILQM
jgi:hypothetical protein